MGPVRGALRAAGTGFLAQPQAIASASAAGFGFYVSRPATGRSPQPVPEYLRRSHGRACAARGAAAGSVERRVHIGAELGEPYAVFLSR